MSNEQKIHIYVWPERFLYLGPSTRTTSHRNHAATWLVAHKGTLRVTLSSGAVLENEVIYVPSETEFATEEAASLISALYWEPESDSFQRAATQFDSSIAHAFKFQYAGIDELESLYNASMSLAMADQLLAKIFGLDTFGNAKTSFSDKRIEEALNFLRDADHTYDSIDALAARVYLSPSRFAHLFKEQVGVPVRRYVLWQKMRRALDLAMAGDSLTTAALSAGFADSAHLSRTVRAIMGVAPEFLFRHRDRLVVHQ
ncbi:MAG: helix-turn-helix domain-containing protein [Pseudomonadota bacterium]